MITDMNTVRDQVIWLATSLVSFATRYDTLGQEDPAFPERIEKMHSCVATLNTCIRDRYTLVDSQTIFLELGRFETMLNSMIKEPRNAEPTEIENILEQMSTATSEMLKVTNKKLGKQST